MVDARNGGQHDKWLEAKKPGHAEYKQMPLTLGYYSREDIPFYYALADAFTVCDQNFCSSLTGTTPNRLYLWTGKIREDANAQARVRNEETDYDREAAWKTFPERLEANNISWKIYQNELSVGAGFEGEEDAWLANFTDNPIEWFSQYHVKFSPVYMRYLPKKLAWLQTEIPKVEEKLKTLQAGSEAYTRLQHQVERGKNELIITQEDIKKYTPESYEKLSPAEKSLHQKAFTTNVNDPDYHTLASLTYQDGTTPREMKVPKGDVLHQFREDVKGGKLPTVSWLVAPENFSDHPGAPWYGAWYLSETIDILAQNPEVWKKTIFILCYDENDGYFDHMPPFVPPHPDKPEAGLVSKGIDTRTEYVTIEQDLKRKPAQQARESSIGLGYRVPLVVASPWSRGGNVCSQVFDHTSITQFMEQWLSHKTGKKIEETNISAWRRTVCGDLTAVFQPYNGEKITLPPFVEQRPFIESIHRAQFKQNPSGYHALTAAEIKQANTQPGASVLPRQEKGTRPSCALPYELYANGRVSDDQQTFQIRFEARRDVFGARSAGSPFQVRLYNNGISIRDYAVAAGDNLTDRWPLNQLTGKDASLQVHGPNGFFRSYQGVGSVRLEAGCDYEHDKKGQLTGHVALRLKNNATQLLTVSITDNAYQGAPMSKTLKAGEQAVVVVPLSKSSGWYDLSIRVNGQPDFEQRFAGRVETGRLSVSDPAMG
jgi:phospholipase C